MCRLVSNLRSNCDVKIKRTPAPAARRTGAFGLDAQSEQEGGELDVRDEAEAGEVT